MSCGLICYRPLSHSCYGRESLFLLRIIAKPRKNNVWRVKWFLVSSSIFIFSLNIRSGEVIPKTLRETFISFTCTIFITKRNVISKAREIIFCYKNRYFTIQIKIRESKKQRFKASCFLTMHRNLLVYMFSWPFANPFCSFLEILSHLCN